MSNHSCDIISLMKNEEKKKVRKKIDRNLLVTHATVLFQQQGYYQTTMDDIANACRLQKSSLYHHVPSRKILVILVMQQTLDYFREHHFNLAYQEHLPIEARLQSMAKLLETYFLEQQHECLMTKLSIEIAESIPEVKKLAANYFDEWIAAITHILSQKISAAAAKQLAQEVVSQIQGGLMLSTFNQNKPILEYAISRLAKLGTI